MRKIVSVLLALSMPVFAQVKSASSTSHHASANASLATPLSWNEFSTRLYQSSPMTTVFSLTTSWIPGQDHKGMLRFKISASPKKSEQNQDLELDTPDAVESFLKRVKDERLMNLDLYDSDGFLLRSIPLPLSYGVGQSSGKIIALITNTAVQMDAGEYRKLIVGGSWGISWTPDPLGPK